MRFLTSLFFIAFFTLPELLSAENPPQTFSLDYIIELTKAHNPYLAQAESDIRSAQGLLISKKAANLPSLDLSGYFTQTDSDRIDSLYGLRYGDVQAWNMELKLSQNLYSGGAISASIKASELQYDAAKTSREQMRMDILQQVHETWNSLLLAREEIRVQEESIKLLSEQLELVKTRFETGEVSRFEVLKAEVSLANARPSLIQARNHFQQAWINLETLSGTNLPDSSEIRIEGTLNYAPIEMSEAEALDRANAKRPELTIQNKAIDMADEDIVQIKSSKRPHIDAFASYGIDKSAFSKDIDKAIYGWKTGISFSWNLWDAKQTKGQLISAHAKLRREKEELRRIKLTINNEVNTALLALKEADELVKASFKVVEQAEESLTLAKNLYAVGNAIQLDLLSAQVDLTEARLNKWKSLYRYSNARVQLQRALGEL